jgi:hypothetical protein
MRARVLTCIRFDVMRPAGFSAYSLEWKPYPTLQSLSAQVMNRLELPRRTGRSDGPCEGVDGVCCDPDVPPVAPGQEPDVSRKTGPSGQQWSSVIHCLSPTAFRRKPWSTHGRRFIWRTSFCVSRSCRRLDDASTSAWTRRTGVTFSTARTLSNPHSWVWPRRGFPGA